MTDATRKQAERQRKRAAGLAPIEIWAYPAQHDAIRQFVRELVSTRPGAIACDRGLVSDGVCLRQ
jgi:hypothetical protein